VTRVAALDCGTNSLRLLIADVDPAAGTLLDVERRMEVVRLGQGVDATGLIAPEALRRALDTTAEYARLCERAQVQAVRFVATSASRDARNRAEFVDGVRALIGVEPEVVSGEEEARLSFHGATRELSGRHPEPFLVVDLGGGSTEVVLGTAAGGVRAALSVDVGCVRMTERHLASDPPTRSEIASATAEVDAALDRVAAAVPLAEARTLVGLAGSVTTVTAHALGLAAYRADLIHAAVLAVPRVLAAADDLLHLTRAERAGLGFLHPGRVDVIGAGALVWSRVVARVAAAAGLARVVTSEHDILDGIAWSLAPDGRSVQDQAS
jgi:exopolyphosphatase/guanosine-5'-triphosphate,3'-diphosphate pyrophosphatase